MYGNYTDEIIEEVRLNSDIVEIVSEYIKLEKKGKDYFGLCPFHKEKTPSFSIAPIKQIFYCFGCGKGGNVIHFIMNIEKLSFAEAVRFLADRARIHIPEGGKEDKEKARLKQEILNINKEAARYFFKTLYSEKGEKAREYLKNRGISEQVVKKFGLGYSIEEWDGLYRYLCEKGFNEESIRRSGLVIQKKRGGFYDWFRGRIIFPIFDVRGNVIGFGGRVLDSSLPKYVNSPETLVYNKGRNLYALNFAKNSNDKSLIIVEGYMDVISLHKHGIINSVASLGTALTENQARLLRRYAEEVIIAYDADASGQSATMKGLNLLSEMGCSVKVLFMPEGKDPDEFISKNGGKAFRYLVEQAASLVEYKVKVLKKEIATDDTEGRIKFLTKVADILAKVDNDIEREIYANKIADEYGITREALYSEILKHIKKKNSVKKRFPDNIKLDSKAASAEKDKKREDEKLVFDERFILTLLCIDNSVYGQVRQKIRADDFSDPENRRVAKIIFERLDSGKYIEPVDLLSIVNEDAVDDFSKIINTEAHCDDILKAILGKIKCIEMHKAEKRLKEIIELLKDEQSLKEGDVARLKKELMSLMTLTIKEQKSG